MQSRKNLRKIIIERILSEATGSIGSASRKNKQAEGDQEKNGAGTAALGVAHNKEVEFTSDFFHGCLFLFSE